MDRPLHQESRTGDAGLPGRGENAGDHALHRVVQVGVVEDDVGRLAAELHRHALQTARGRFVDALTSGVRAGERHLGHQRVLDQRPAHLVTESGHHVHDSGREARLLHQRHQLQRRRRGVLRRLDHDRVAGGQRRRHLPRRQQQGRVPRDDRRHHPQRLPPCVVEDVGLVGGHHRALDLVGQAAVVVVPLRHVRRVREHLGIQLAVVADVDLGQTGRVLGHQLTQPPQQHAAPGGRHARPLPRRERAVRGTHGAVHVLGRSAWDQRPGRAQVGVIGLEIVAAGRFGGGPVDVQLVEGQGRRRGHDPLLYVAASPMVKRFLSKNRPLTSF